MSDDVEDLPIRLEKRPERLLEHCEGKKGVAGRGDGVEGKEGGKEKGEEGRREVRLSSRRQTEDETGERTYLAV